jgi:small subunit ribosomal protein S17
MPRRVLQGVVVSDSTKRDKTITVLVTTVYRHPVYHKTVKRTKKYTAHDELNKCVAGDFVKITECRPISKTKTWVVSTT